jgi:alpha-D-ribose 1-methylphosphonate 5-triphosphate diphosphatase
MDEILTNARLVLDDRVVLGTLTHAGGVIRDLSEGVCSLPGAVDLEGDLLAPGLIECHTDNLEKHAAPRPGVVWPDALAAALAHDAQMATSGVTTVYDALFVGGYEVEDDPRKHILPTLTAAIETGVAEGVFRIAHRLHLRCELSDPELPERLAPHLGRPLVALVSLMDHTPGQRQWRDVAALKRFMVREGLAAAEAEALLARRMRLGVEAAAVNRPYVLDLFRNAPIRLASHDDTTEAHVAEAVQSGCAISEFPTTMAAARAAHAAGLAVVAGAPNVVRGGSHAGGVAAEDLAREGVLDALSSDYVPSSLLQAVGRLARGPGIALHEAFAFATSKPAEMLGLADRGRLAPGMRADFVRLRFVRDTPVVASVSVAGRRVA